MKKLFLIPLLTLVCSVMAWGTTYQVGTYAQLKAALEAGDATLIELTADITYDGAWSTYNSDGLYDANAKLTGLEDALCIKNSLTLDGKGYQIVGFGKHNVSVTAASNFHRTTLAVHPESASAELDVTIKNLSLGNKSKNKRYYGIITFDGVKKLKCENVEIACNKYSYQQPLCFTGATNDKLELVVENSSIKSGASAYPAYILKPIEATLTNSLFEGYCALYFKYRATGVYGSVSGARGSIVNATACDFNAPNVHDGYSNDFAVFVCEDDNITLNLVNCGMNAQELGNAVQTMVSASEHATRREGNITINISGDNSHINGVYVANGWNFKYGTASGNADSEIFSNGYWQKYNSTKKTYDKSGFEPSLAFTPYTGRVNVTISGGTYSVNPETYTFNGHVTSAEDISTFETRGITIPDGYEVKTITMEGVATPLYRVVKKAQEKEAGVMYDLNDFVPVEGEDYGNNPVSSFDLSTGTDMTLNQETTTAGYVEVKDNADTSDPTTVTVGTPTEDQTLVINNGLDVQGDSKVDVQAGSTLVIGEGGIVTSKPENIVIEADRAGAASLIMDPAITVNQTPNLTVRMTAKQIGKTADGEFWHRFAMPVQHANSWDKEGSLGTGNDKYPTYLYGWNYSSDSWYKLPGGVSDMQAFMGYTLRLATEETSATTLQDVVYIFKGQLAGNTNNTLQFSRNGYNFFGNSYTGYIDLKQLVAQITGDSKIEGTAWVWNTNSQRYQDVPLNLLADGEYDGESDKWKTEIAPMQTFILKQNGSENASTEINYASAVWGNPRYSAATGVAAAPARRVANVNTTRMYIAVTAANGQSDEVFFVEDAKYSDAFDNGYDASKYMNPNTINVFANQNGIDLGTVASDNLNGKTLSLKTNGELAYTMSFKNVEGEEFAIRDNVTGAVIAIEEGTTYEFAAQPNSTIEGRFEIIGVHQVTTAIENTEVKANVKGIYTIMGQYLGENFDILPAGVYVVDGVKIVK